MDKNFLHNNDIISYVVIGLFSVASFIIGDIYFENNFVLKVVVGIIGGLLGFGLSYYIYVFKLRNKK